jgi:hypothetical protein
VARDAFRLLAVVRNTTLVEFGVQSGARMVIADVAPDAIADGPALSLTGETRLTTRGGLLLGYRDARETFRHSVGPPSTVASLTFADAGLPPVVDRTGATVSVTPAGAVTIALPSGEVRTSHIADCGLPAALLPAGDRLLAVFCRSGFIAIVGDPGPRPENRPRHEGAANPKTARSGAWRARAD